MDSFKSQPPRDDLGEEGFTQDYRHHENAKREPVRESRDGPEPASCRPRRLESQDPANPTHDIDLRSINVIRHPDPLDCAIRPTTMKPRPSTAMIFPASPREFIAHTNSFDPAPSNPRAVTFHQTNPGQTLTILCSEIKTHPSKLFPRAKPRRSEWSPSPMRMSRRVAGAKIFQRPGRRGLRTAGSVGRPPPQPPLCVQRRSFHEEARSIPDSSDTNDACGRLTKRSQAKLRLLMFGKRRQTGSRPGFPNKTGDPHEMRLRGDAIGCRDRSISQTLDRREMGRYDGRESCRFHGSQNRGPLACDALACGLTTLVNIADQLAPLFTGVAPAAGAGDGRERDRGRPARRGMAQDARRLPRARCQGRYRPALPR